MKKTKTPKPTPPLKLNLGSGKVRIEGFTNVDISKMEGVDIVHDLNKYPWPFKDESVDEILCSHYVEHIPHDIPGYVGRDGFYLFFNEVYRILKSDGTIKVIGPYWANERAFQDPTHRRFIGARSFLYLNKEWLFQNGLSHYHLTGDFDFAYGWALAQQWVSRSQETRDFALQHYVNVADDIHVTLTKRPRK